MAKSPTPARPVQGADLARVGHKRSIIVLIKNEFFRECFRQKIGVVIALPMLCISFCFYFEGLPVLFLPNRAFWERVYRDSNPSPLGYFIDFVGTFTPSLTPPCVLGEGASSANLTVKRGDFPIKIIFKFLVFCKVRYWNGTVDYNIFWGI